MTGRELDDFAKLQIQVERLIGHFESELGNDRTPGNVNRRIDEAVKEMKASNARVHERIDRIEDFAKMALKHLVNQESPEKGLVNRVSQIETSMGNLQRLFWGAVGSGLTATVGVIVSLIFGAIQGGTP